MPKHLSKTLISWASIIDDVTTDQAITSAQMPFIHPHLALMPDAHFGKGSTVGSVIPTRGAIMPAAIGVDIGCGMSALRTNLTLNDIQKLDLKTLRLAIEATIPVSAGKYNATIQDDAQAWVDILEAEAERLKVDPDAYNDTWRRQLGTLGGGNHFIEICVDEENQLWVFLHSGSRGIGNKIARKHIQIAADLCKKWFINLPHPDLAYLPQGTPEFDDYIRHLTWGQKFAAANRDVMLTRTYQALKDWAAPLDVTEIERVLCHHNYTTQESHFGTNVWVSRKGAIDAHEGVLGLIPGSMGTRSYVVRGKGNPVALASAPHGAGRVHSRNQARRLFTQNDLRDRMAGIEYRDDEAFIDEIPDAYKPIDQVMEDSADLVEIVHELRQIINVKGQ